MSKLSISACLVLNIIIAGWLPGGGRSYKWEEMSAGGEGRGEYGWVEAGGEVVRVTSYTADTRGYRQQQTVSRLQTETQQETERSNPYEDLLIVGPIPPFLRRKNNNP